MKKYFLLILIVLSFCNCSKDDECSEENEIVGSWVWIETYGGYGGFIYTPESTGEQRKMLINSCTIRRFVNNELKTEFNYSLVTKDPYLFNEEHLVIEYEAMEFPEVVYFQGDTLILFEDCSDCFRRIYVRE